MFCVSDWCKKSGKGILRFWSFWFFQNDIFTSFSEFLHAVSNSNPIYSIIWILLKVIEHVANPVEFCKSLAALTVPDGATVISTVNRSMRAYATAIVAAEYLLRWVLLYHSTATHCILLIWCWSSHCFSSYDTCHLWICYSVVLKIPF